MCIRDIFIEVGESEDPLLRWVCAIRLRRYLMCYVYYCATWSVFVKHV